MNRNNLNKRLDKVTNYTVYGLLVILFAVFFFQIVFIPENKTIQTNDAFIREQIVNRANLIFNDHTFSSKKKDKMDCSGFVVKVYRNVGLKLPRSSSMQYEYITKVDSIEAKPGDLIFFGKPDNINHVGIYLGDSSFIHASSSRGITVSRIGEQYWSNRLVGFGSCLISPKTFENTK
jgi:hypothetical protein